MKKDSRQRLFEVMERLNPEFSNPTDNIWAIFVISYGQKGFVTQLSGADNKFFGEYRYDVKYNDPSVLKFSLEDAKELIERNKRFDERFGLVNDKGMQLVQGKYDGIWQRGRMEENETETIKPKLILPVGISGSGKSTWIKANTDTNTIVVSPDDIRRELTGSISDQSRNNEVFNLAFQRTAEALNAGKNVIFDATNVTSKSRRGLRDYMKVHVDKSFEGVAKIFDVSPEIAKQRVKKDVESGVDRSNVPDYAIDRQYQNFINDLNSIELDGFKIID